MKLRGHIFTALRQITILCLLIRIAPIVNAQALQAKQLNDKWEYVNTEGPFVILPMFDAVYPFASEELTSVTLNLSWGYIDTTGKFVIEPQFEGIYDFQSNDLVAVRLRISRLYH